MKRQFKNRTQEVFHRLLKKQGIGYTQVKVGSLAGTYRLYNGKGAMRAKAIDAIAKFFGADGKDLIHAWLLDKAEELPTRRKVVIAVE
jgi:hypothetical protein